MVNLQRAFADDGAPLDETCGCPACRLHGRAYLHHLFKAAEMLGPMLLTWHNVQYYQDLMRGCGQPLRTTDWSACRCGARRLAPEEPS